MAARPLKHALIRHHLPGLRSGLLGIVLALTILLAAFNCPTRGVLLGACGTSFLLVVVLVLLFVPRQVRHLWHTIEHSDLLVQVAIAAVAVAVLIYVPGSGLVRAATAVAVFAGLTLLKWTTGRRKV